MKKRKLTENQKYYLALVPDTMKGFPMNAKLFVGKLLQVHYSTGEPKYIYLGDNEIYRDTGMDWKQVKLSRTLLVAKKLIYWVKGTYGVASHYILLFDENGEVKKLDNSLVEEVNNVFASKVKNNNNLEAKNEEKVGITYNLLHITNNESHLTDNSKQITSNSETLLSSNLEQITSNNNSSLDISKKAKDVENNIIEEKTFAIKDKNSEEEMKKKLDKLYDKLYKEDLSTNRVNEENPIVKEFTDYIVNDLTERYLKDKKRYEELENGLKVANMVLSKNNFYDNYHTERLSKEEQEKVRTDAEKIINERTNERIGQMKGKAMEERNKRLLGIYTNNFSSSKLDNSLYNHSCDDGRSHRIIYNIILDAKSAHLINEDEEEDFKGVCEAVRLTYKERKEQKAEATSTANC